MGVDESGDPIIGVYQPWFLEQRDAYIGVSESHLMFLKQIHGLLNQGVLKLEHAQLNESAFFLNYWEWVDRPDIQLGKKKFSELMRDALLIKTRKQGT